MWQLEIENVAGIRSGITELHSGANAVQASNWQGKTSLLTAIRTVMGADITPNVLTDGENQGHVELSADDGTTYRADLKADGESVIRNGTTYLPESQDRICAELFAFLDERNEIRQAVRNGADLTPFLTRPLEEENIEAQVADLKDERRRAETELERAKEATSKLRRKDERVQQLESELEELRAELAEFEEDGDTDSPEENLRDELNAARTSHERTQQAIERQERQVESIESELDEKQATLEELEPPDDPELESDLEQKRDRLDEFEAQIDTLRTLYNANKQVLDQDQLDLVADVDRRISGDAVTCWVCDTETTPDAIEIQLAELSDTITRKRDAASDLRQEVDDLEDQQRHIEQKRQQRHELEREISELQSRLDERREDLMTNRDKLDELASTIEELEDQVQETDDRQKTLEEEIVRREAKLEDLREEIEKLEQQADKRDAIETQIETITTEIEDLRSRRERTIEEARTAFEAAFEDVIDNFGPSFEAARLDKHPDPDTGRTTKLELVIARGGREISVNRLSEGEVELVGFIAALAGYKAFDVADRVPCILLDDVGGLASEHLHTLVEYLEDRTEYLVTSAYPEAGEFDGYTISPAEWTVVSDRKEAPA